jgi:hypothetical protein
MHAGRILKLGTQRAILARAGLTDADVDRLL